MKYNSQTFIILQVVLQVVLSSVSSAFTFIHPKITTTIAKTTSPSSSLTTIQNRIHQHQHQHKILSKQQTTTTSQLQLLIDPHFITTLTENVVIPTTVSSLVTDGGSFWLSDNTPGAVVDAVVSETAAVSSTTGSWWDAYLNIFKTGIETIHTLVDPPLRSIGFDQTWGVSIALFTISIRSLLVPLSLQQSKSTEYMKALKPYTKEINAKFANNDEAKSRALSKLYEDANQNPLSGCLVSLAQLPIFLGLYRGVRLLAIDGKLNEGFLWIPSLEGPVTVDSDYRGLDWLTSNWNNGIPSLGWETTISFLIMPFILVLLQSFTMNILQPPMDDTDTSTSTEEKETIQRTQTILKFLPLLIGFFSLQVPAGLTIYWFSSNLFTVSQSLIVKAYYAANPPKINLPDYWDSALSGETNNLSPDERRKAAVAGLSVGPTLDEIIDQSKFHVYINRHSTTTNKVISSSSSSSMQTMPSSSLPIVLTNREESTAWKQLQLLNEIDSKRIGTVPTQLQEWVTKYQVLYDDNNNNSNNSNNINSLNGIHNKNTNNIQSTTTAAAATTTSTTIQV